MIRIITFSIFLFILLKLVP